MKLKLLALTLLLASCTVDVAPDGSRRYTADNVFWGEVAQAAVAGAAAKAVEPRPVYYTK